MTRPSRLRNFSNTGLIRTKIRAARELDLHILITTDTLSGVWTHTRELATGLVSRGIRVTLVSFGEIPLPQETAWMDRLHGLQYLPT
ncbi:MAG: glycosyl transferase, group 1, partial [Acidobacteriaceae bacterium]|nr:glycosyl transferase, group 1 [Acidobacteriaceae bacterium]